MVKNDVMVQIHDLYHEVYEIVMDGMADYDTQLKEALKKDPLLFPDDSVDNAMYMARIMTELSELLDKVPQTIDVVLIRKSLCIDLRPKYYRTVFLQTHSIMYVLEDQEKLVSEEERKEDAKNIIDPTLTEEWQLVYKDKDEATASQEIEAINEKIYTVNALCRELFISQLKLVQDTFPAFNNAIRQMCKLTAESEIKALISGLKAYVGEHRASLDDCVMKKLLAKTGSRRTTGTAEQWEEIYDELLNSAMSGEQKLQKALCENEISSQLFDLSNPQFSEAVYGAIKYGVMADEMMKDLEEFFSLMYMLDSVKCRFMPELKDELASNYGLTTPRMLSSETKAAEKAVDDFVAICKRLFIDIDDKWNGRRVNQGGNRGDAEVKVNIDKANRIVSLLQCDHLAALSAFCFHDAHSFVPSDVCYFIGYLQAECRVFGSLTTKALAECLADDEAIRLKSSSIQGLLSDRKALSDTEIGIAIDACQIKYHED